MALITLGFDVDKEAAGLPEGTYKFQVVSAEPKTSQSGNPMISVRSEVIEDPQYTGKSVFDNITLIPSAAFKLQEFCNAIGLDYRNGIDPDQWASRTFYGDVEHREYEGRTQVQIKKYRAHA